MHDRSLFKLSVEIEKKSQDLRENYLLSEKVQQFMEINNQAKLKVKKIID